MSTIRKLEQAAIDAHWRGMRWGEFWPTVADLVEKAEPFDRERYHRLVDRLLHLLLCGDLDGQEPPGQPVLPRDWDDERPRETCTRARCLLPLRPLPETVSQTRKSGDED